MASDSIRLARRLTELRQTRQWTLEQLTEESAVSRATLSRIERGEVSPTAQVLGKLAKAYGLPMQAFFTEADTSASLHMPVAQQTVWEDPETGFVRRNLSPTLPGFRGSMIEGLLPAGKTIAYAAPPLSGLEHHLVLLEGALEVTLDRDTHWLSAGDCLRFRLDYPNSYHAPGPHEARYILTVILP
ncbi:helix-turn-helix domain-containing protein [Roseibium sp.]|uniref:helix-turn-helix domain-containing protein n=1 Tax=Roseibium sp. TaxID=1936156 RepID=UPI003A978CC7